MPSVRDIMTFPAVTADGGDTLREVARKLAEAGVGSLPVCGSDQKLIGMISDRDVVVKCLALDGDPDQQYARELAQGRPVTVPADADLEDAITSMQRHQIRRIPVLDGDQLVGVISQVDIARSYPEDALGDLAVLLCEHD